MRVPHTTLKVLAAATWYVGGGILLLRGAGYLLRSASDGGAMAASLAALAGVAIGVLRGRTMFLRACRRNLRRIEALERPRIWQFFRPAFFAALVAMMGAGALLSWIAGTGRWGAIAVGGLELVIALALLTSSVAYWQATDQPGTEPVEGAGASRNVA